MTFGRWNARSMATHNNAFGCRPHRACLVGRASYSARTCQRTQLPLVDYRTYESLALTTKMDGHPQANPQSHPQTSPMAPADQRFQFPKLTPKQRRVASCTPFIQSTRSGTMPWHSWLLRSNIFTNTYLSQWRLKMARNLLLLALEKHVGAYRTEFDSQ